MSKPKKSVIDEGQSVPGWIVSFSDMVTLLLAFFVLLQTFAHVQDPELFYAGQGSFRRAVSGFGLSTMFSGEIEAPTRDWRKIKYPTDHKTKDLGVERVIDNDDEQIRQAFKKMRDEMEVQASSQQEKIASVFSTPIVFPAGGVDLDEAAMRYLGGLAADLRRTVDPDTTRLYIVGLAADEEDSRSRWIISARRAEAVHQALVRLLGGGSRRWTLCCWGAGLGGRWCRKNGITAYRKRGGDRGGTHVAVTVVRVTTR